MATKEDILEQLVEGYLLQRGYFVRHNVKFKPRPDHPQFNSRHDSNHSDIDVLALHPTLRGTKRVMAVSCKSWQDGFNADTQVAAINGNKKMSGRAAWKSYRELTSPKWSEAFIAAIREATGQSRFTYVTAVTKLRGNRDAWEKNPKFRDALGGNPIQIVELRQMLREVVPGLTTTMAGTELGRVLQLLKAADLDLLA